MSGLSHLYIRGNHITNAGLIAILDGCPLLETLNIGRCYNLDLSESLRKRCLEQIKDVMLPIQHHSEDYDYDDRVKNGLKPSMFSQVAKPRINTSSNRFKYAGTSWDYGTYSIIEAEALALKEAVQAAIYMNMEEVIFESETHN
ncbi:hypothetical protein TSUD_123810 [Trifolium subterraneum]|uniref:Uncharacterized protein n=1 Tax=Trifolium subterraneum TaxID=3900 RepID=A0A2Z6P282_TRISU|nr:hypothetical protein TSUD_123810 [Trifolium subterraneum]